MDGGYLCWWIRPLHYHHRHHSAAYSSKLRACFDSLTPDVKGPITLHCIALHMHERASLIFHIDQASHGGTYLNAVEP
jgi:hypothetical protein